jgi:hypothetical protein
VLSGVKGHCLVAEDLVPLDPEIDERSLAAPELPAGAAPPAPSRGLLLAEPPDPAASLAELGYKGALEQCSRQIVAAGLAQSQGRIGEASRLLGLSPKATGSDRRQGRKGRQVG